MDTIPAPLTSSFDSRYDSLGNQRADQDEGSSLGRVLVLAVLLAVVAVFAFLR